MITVKQSFYDTFECIAGDCPGTCCQGWEIEIDEDTLQKYKDYEGPCKELLETGVNYNTRLFKLLGNERCFMLRDDGLCKLVKEHGEPILCDTCHMFPRHCEEYEGIREWSVTLSCPEVARIIINGGPAEYVVEEDDLPDPLEDEFEDFDVLLFTKLEDSREVIYKIVQDKSINIFDRMDMILKFSLDLQGALDDDETFKMDDLIEEWSDYKNKITSGDYLRTFEYVNKHFNAMTDVEQLKADWIEVVESMQKLIDGGENYFNDKLKEFNDKMDSLPPVHDDIFENILMSYLYTFYLGAVYDDMIFAKVAMSVYFTIMIDRLTFANKFIGREEDFNIKDYEDIAYRFTRELEHSDNNLNQIEDYWDDCYPHY